MFTTRRILALTAVAASSAFVACKGHQNAATDSANGMSAPAAAPSTAMADTGAKPAMSDANILAATDVGDSAEVAVGKYMSANGTNAEVKSFASQLVRDHSKGKKTVDSLAKALNVSMALPAGDTTSQSASNTLDHLKSLKGKDRDTAFVQHEIADHQQVIDEANKMLSAATQPDVKSMLQKELPELQKHLDRAQAISTSMAKK